MGYVESLDPDNVGAARVYFYSNVNEEEDNEGSQLVPLDEIALLNTHLGKGRRTPASIEGADPP